MNVPRFGAVKMPASSLIVTPGSLWPAIVADLVKNVHTADQWFPTDVTAALTVSQIKEVRAFASKTSTGDYKMVLLPGADAWRNEVANMLLKLLEEPPENLYLILLSESRSVLPTIRSRVQELTLSPDMGDGQAGGQKQAWRELLNSYNLQDGKAQERVQYLLQMQSLLHTGIKEGPIVDLYKRERRI